jgi:hypothetical protein
VKDFLDQKCSDMKYVDIAKTCGMSLSMLYNIRAQGSSSYHMHTVFRVMFGLSRLLNKSAEDLFVEYILGEVVNRYPDRECNDMRMWLDAYRGEMTYKDLCDRVGIDQTRMSVWLHKGGRPSDSMLRWLLQGMEGDSEEMCRSYFRMAKPQG